MQPDRSDSYESPDQRSESPTEDSTTRWLACFNHADAAQAHKTEQERLADMLCGKSILPDCTIGKGESTKFLALFEKNLDRLDTDDDGVVSKNELRAAAQDTSIKGEDAALVAALITHRERLEKLGDEEDGISQADAEEFEGLRDDWVEYACEGSPELHELTMLKEYLDKNFKDMDKDGDGKLQPQEWKDACDKEPEGSDERYLLEHMMDTELAEGMARSDPNPSIGPWRFKKSAFDAYYKKAVEDFVKEYGADTVRGVEATMKYAQDAMRSSLDGASRKLYADSSDPLKDITPEAVRQGGLNDCYFLSAVASVAKNNPQAIKDMIKENKDGTFTVTFPGAPDEPITVSAPSDLELGWYAQGSRHGVWPAVLEKAYGAWSEKSLMRQSVTNWGDDKTTPQDAIDGGSATSNALEMLTGKSVDTYLNVTESEDSIHEKLSQAVKDHQAVTSWIFFNTVQDVAGVLGAERNTEGLASGHVYSVLDYDPKTRRVQVRNPWGHGEPGDANGTAKDGKNDGVFWVDLKDFMKWFGGVKVTEK